ncbi:hypothetical protein GCM10010094_86800 [Streptomyces flaveus]|uniref:Uncharacterized protein n=1 Tax=Streptomyces flaveus TaxID=66370 RepID=A0A917VTA9_9ACTN|nr:hypothetical protein GCM10010094_86800 [Streptomyces flaveus]
MCNCTPPWGQPHNRIQTRPKRHSRPLRDHPDSPRPLTLRQRARTKKIALDPAESSAIDDAPLLLEVLARAWALLGQNPRRLELWFEQSGTLGEPAEMPCYAVVQASVRCCGMPASSARTSASR